MHAVDVKKLLYRVKSQILFKFWWHIFNSKIISTQYSLWLYWRRLVAVIQCKSWNKFSMFYYMSSFRCHKKLHLEFNEFQTSHLHVCMEWTQCSNSNECKEHRMLAYDEINNQQVVCYKFTVCQYILMTMILQWET